ncbi:hypothetical protein A9Q84_00775 [Halobacteriovorax marinus]|uniref:Response regulatory domain-containing protein n=1 Tax=Halobacteriovorax marinus TaxID=97084 RepID=A0A1Y5FFQ7_9BACT|nr:hypothetical protein A9Q84_00775 [Halobacteriovorax marinus]
MLKYIMNRIVYIDDNPAKIQAFQENLKDFQVTAFENPFEALDAIKTLTFEAIILDIMIPLLDGFQLYERITKSDTYSGQPIFFLSSTNDIDVKLRALSLGSCELLTPEMSWPEKVQRIYNKLNSANQTSTVLSIEGINFDHNIFKVTKEGLSVELTPKEFFLFKLIVENKEISTIEVIEKVWNNTQNMSENNLSTHFSNLNKKIRSLGFKVSSKRGNVFVRSLTQD